MLHSVSLFHSLANEFFRSKHDVNYFIILVISGSAPKSELIQIAAAYDTSTTYCMLRTDLRERRFGESRRLEWFCGGGGYWDCK